MLGFDYLQLIIGIMGLAINVSAQVLIFRNFPGFGLLKSEYTGFLIGLLFLAALESFTLYQQAGISMVNAGGILAANTIIYCSLGYCYFHFVNLGETARRIRILRELYDVKDGLWLEEILERYNADEITRKRIDRLIRNRQISFEDGRYYVHGAAVLFMARAMDALKHIILGREDNAR